MQQNLLTPISVLEHNITDRFYNINLKIRKLHDSMKGVVDPCIQVETNPSLFYGPCVDLINNKIMLTESFLCFLWSFSYFLLTFQETTNDLISKNPDALFLNRNSGINEVIFSMFEFSNNIAKYGYIDWPENLPSPAFISQPTNEIEEYIGKTNNIFLNAITFLLMHEMGHIVGKHVDYARLQQEIKQQLKCQPKYEIKETDINSIKIIETEADNFAFDSILSLDNDDISKVNIYYGIISAFTSMLFSITNSRSIMQVFHPNIDERVCRCLEKLDDYYLLDYHETYFYHLASQMFVLFLDKYGIIVKSYNADMDVKNYLSELLKEIQRIIIEKET